MDDIVKAALSKWPNVPACRGWLGLDARGNWYMRDDRTQAAGPFSRAKGSRIEHEKLREFIQRNYAADEAGAWFFQNGPQRVYVELEVAPWVWRLTLDAAGAVQIHSHSGLPAEFESAWVDDAGRLFIATGLGLGLVHTQDMGTAADQVEHGTWPIHEMPFSNMPRHFGYRLSPQADAAERAAGTDGSTGSRSRSSDQAP